jgi:hypothetical protein
MTKRSLPVIDPGRAEFGFLRTACACAACAAHCLHLPGYLIPADLDRVGHRLAPPEGLTTWARRHLLASPGALVRRGTTVFRIPTLVPARRADGACTFLTAENRCAIHAVAPFGCAFFDAHQPGAEAERRCRRGLQAVLDAWTNGAVYARVWLALDAAGLRAPPPETCRLGQGNRSKGRRDVPTPDPMTKPWPR